MLLRGTQKIIVCPARSTNGYRFPTGWKKPIAEGRLILQSQFPDDVRRVTARTSEFRNRHIVAFANAFFIPYAAPDSKTESLAKEIATTGKPLYTLISPETANLRALGAADILGFIDENSTDSGLLS